jgi:hypothetical protein
MKRFLFTIVTIIGFSCAAQAQHSHTMPVPQGSGYGPVYNGNVFRPGYEHVPGSTWNQMRMPAGSFWYQNGYVPYQSGYYGPNMGFVPYTYNRPYWGYHRNPYTGLFWYGFGY